MAGLVPAIHFFDLLQKKEVDARPKAGHDESILILVAQPQAIPNSRCALR
jgi:hypothetical protein